MTVSYPTKIILAYRSGDKCALPDCRIHLSQEGEDGSPYNIGEAAHIAGERDGGKRGQQSARYDPNMTEAERNNYDNLIYLCRNCHKKIDAIPQGEKNYPVERLQDIKMRHGQKVQEAVSEAFANVGFPELEDATRWITQINPQQPNRNFSVIPPADKLEKNKLGDTSRMIITMGLSVSNEVRAFIESFTQIDHNFPERLKSGFLEEYYRLKRKDYSGDELFDLMCQFAQRGFTEETKRSAGKAVLVYLFETCEVFEK